MSDGPVIRIEALTKRFGDLVALDGLDLEVGKGEVFGYLGPNGAGKTTTIRVLLDFLRPTSGSAMLLGGSGSDPAIRARVGYLPGDLQLDPAYTTSEIVEFYGALRGGVDRRRVESLLERFDLDPARPLGELSTGNRRKAGIVAAFMHAPEVLLLDEPTSGLDPLLQHEFHLLVGEAVREGATVFLSSHVLPEVEVLAKRVAILRRGQLIKVASIDDLRAQARQRIDVYLDGAGGPEDFAGVPGVVEASGGSGVVHLVVEGHVDAVVKAAARLTVLRLVTHEADLEEVFLDLYGRDT